jgi:hypothetical protein
MKQLRRKASEVYDAPVKKTISDHEIHFKKALELQETMNKAKAELEEEKEYFYNLLKNNPVTKKLHFKTGSVQLEISNSYSIGAEYIDELKSIFPETYDVMVNEKVNFAPTAALRKLATQADYKHIDTVRKSILITTNNSIKFTAVKA